MKLALAALLTATLLAAPALAEERLDLSVGGWDVFKDSEEGPRNHMQLVGGAEYRSEYFWKHLRGDLGVLATNQSAQYYYGGLGYDFFLDDGHHFVITPNEALGYYHQQAGKDLGGGMEFKSGIEADYQFDNGHRLGVAIHHISNAHIYDRNPGTELATVHYSIPLSVFEK